MIQQIKITPMGGVGEIGAINCMVYETANDAVIVDCGSMFPDQETLGVDFIIPDFTYLNQIRHKIRGLVLTHGHEDHIGATPFLLQEMNTPVFGAPFTLGLIKQKLEEHHLPKKPRLVLFKPGSAFEVGPFKIDTIFVNHSIPDSSALVLQTPGGPIVHLTDWKIDKNPIGKKTTDLKKFASLAKKGVLVLLSDSTNINRPGSTLSEKEVATQLRKVCAQHKGRIIVALFASNIHRIQSLAFIAKSLNRKLAFVGRSMHEDSELARQLGYLNFDGIDLIDVEETRELIDEKVLVLATGSQGEPRSVLTRMAFDQFKPFKVREGDLVLFSSKIIPGNEKNVFSIINHLCRRGADVIYEGATDIHTSGHAHQDELKKIFKILKPKYFIPIHGEYRHLLRHAECAVSWGLKKDHAFVMENGQSVVLSKGIAHKEGIVPTGRVFVDGKGVGDVSPPVMRDRRHLADTGIVVCVLMIDRNSGAILRGPDLISRGFISEEENQPLFEQAKKKVVEVLESFNFEERTEMVTVQEEVRITLRRFFGKELDRKPVVIPVIQEM